MPIPGAGGTLSCTHHQQQHCGFVSLKSCRAEGSRVPTRKKILALQQLDQKAIKVASLHGNQKEGPEAMLHQHAPAQAPLEAGAPLEHPSVR